MRKNEDGAVIVEATLFLPFFMFAIILVLSITNICFAQARIGSALNATAKEISEYSYVYGLTGLNKKQAELYEAAGVAYASTDQIVNGVGELFDSMATIQNTATSSYSNALEYGEAALSIYDEAGSCISAVEDIGDAVGALASNPTSLLKMFANEGIEIVKSYLVGQVTPMFMKKHLTGSENGNAENLLRYLGVVPKGDSHLKGIDYTDSVIFLNGSPEIKLIAKYQIQVWRFLGVDWKMSFSQCAATKAWFAEQLEFTDMSTPEEPEDPEETTEPTEETTEPPFVERDEYKIVEDCIQNDSAKKVFFSSSGTSTGYADGTTLVLDENAKKQIAADPEMEWKIQHVFIMDQYSKGKEFYFEDDPNGEYSTVYAEQIKWFEDHNFKFEPDPGLGVWKAVHIHS